MFYTACLLTFLTAPRAAFADGSLVWSAPLGSSTGMDIALDGTGIYVTRSVDVAGNRKWQVEKRSFIDGSLIGTFGAGGVANDNTIETNRYLKDIAVTGTGIYVGGMEYLWSAYRNDLHAYNPGTNTWNERTRNRNPGSPALRYAATTVWDPVNNQLLMFGGYGGVFYNDLWAYDPVSNSWTQRFPVGGPPVARSGHAAAWDTANNRMLVWGGTRAGGYPTDLWAYVPDTNTWVQLIPDSDPGSPLGRNGHGVAWDTFNSRLLMFGGRDSGATYRNDLWSYNPGSNLWTQLSPGGTLPSVREGHTAVWDSTNRRLLIFGGNFGVYYNDLWAYDPFLNNWTQLVPSGTLPPVRTSHGAGWDSVNGRMLIFGGAGSGGGPRYDLWAYNIFTNSWTDLTANGFICAKMSHGLAWDSFNNQLLAFGGSLAVMTPVFTLRIEKWDLAGNFLWETDGCSPPGSLYFNPGDFAIDNTGMYAVNVGDWGVQKRDLNLNGRLIPTFGTTPGGGQEIINPSNNFDWARNTDSDGTSLYVAGDVDRNNVDMGRHFRVEKRNINTGALDPSFGGTGYVQYFPTQIPTNGRFGLDVDSTGVYLMVNEALGGTDYQVRFLKWGLNGSLQWDVVSDRPGAPSLGFSEMAVDSTGLYAVGSQRDCGSCGNYLRIEKRDLNNGNLLWSFTNSVTSNGGGAVVPDGTGEFIYVLHNVSGPLTLEKRKAGGYVDCGISMQTGSGPVALSCEPSGTVTSPLRIYKNSEVRGMGLVPVTDNNASKLRIQTPSGVKALRKQ